MAKKGRLEAGTPLAGLLAVRRSVRDYEPTPIMLGMLRRLLWAANGVVDGRRTVPSAGALHALTVHVAAGRVDGLAPGVYRYEPPVGELCAVSGQDVRSRLGEAAIEDQPWLVSAAAVIAWTAALRPVIEHYAGQPPAGRGERYVWLEAGCSLQNVYLQTAALGFGGVFVGAFDAASVSEAFALGADQQVMGLFAVGVPARRA